jgi:adenylylsulfate kinase
MRNLKSTSLLIPTIVITGPVGIGKTAVSSAMSDLLIAANEPHALIDMDHLRMSFPRPPEDRFHMALGLRNLAALWANYRAAGAECLLLADVVESQADADAYRAAVPSAEVTVVRLLASRETLWSRLARRESGESLRWHQNRAVELAALMDKEAISDVLVETDEKTIPEVADEILRLVF